MPANWLTRRQVRSAPQQRISEAQAQALLDVIDRRMERVNDTYLQVMGAHIRDIGTLKATDVHRLQQMRRLSANMDTVRRELARAAGITERELAAIYAEAAKVDVRMALDIMHAAGAISLRDNEPLMRIIRAEVRETAGKMRNLANTTVVSRPYQDVIDRAVTAVQRGTTDYSSAIRSAVRRAGQSGLRVVDGTTVVDYESGWSRRLDSAARMNVLDGVRHLNQSIMEEVGRQTGADGVEISAHMLCAEDHLPYQGTQMTNEAFEQLQDSLPRPFGEWNCKHMWWPVVLGISERAYTDDQLRQYEAYSTDRITIDGRTKTRYEWSQEMRRCETAIRQQKDVANLAKACGDTTLRRQAQAGINALNDRYDQIVTATGLPAEDSRMSVSGFRRVKAESGLTKTAFGDIIKKEDISIIHSLGAKATVSEEDEIDVPNSITPAHFVPNSLIRNVHVFAGKGTKTPLRERFSLEEYYEGTVASEWEKVKGIARVVHKDEEHVAEVHWYHEDSIGGVEYKIKRQPDGRLWLDES